MRRRVLAALLAGGLALAGACSSGQDPGIDQQIETNPTGSTLPPKYFEECPPGGPDETTPPAGCLDEEGNVVHP